MRCLAVGCLLLVTPLVGVGRLHAEASPAAAPVLAVQPQSEDPAFQHERAVADEVLRRPEFQRNTSLSWWERKKQQLQGILAHMFDRVHQLGKAAPWLARTLEWLFFVGASVGLLVFLLRQMARQRLRVSLTESTMRPEVWTREADDWSLRAEAYAHEQAWRDAVHCLYWAAIVLLESRRAWKHNPTRTPREYVRLLKPGSPQQQGLRGLTQIFERTWYGLRETDAEEYAQARLLYDGLVTTSGASHSLTAGPLELAPAKAEGL